MIRFCDGMVYTLNKDEWTRDTLLKAIEEKNLENVCFQLYIENECIGTISKADLLNTEKTLDECIQREKIYFDENVFEKCNAFLTKKEFHSFVPVYNGSDEIVYVAYEDKGNVAAAKEIAVTLDTLCKIEYVSFPQVQAVYLYDCNELSYKLYRYLKQRNIPYKIFGEKWKMLGMERYEMEIEKVLDVPDYARMCIHGEDIESFPIEITSPDFYRRKSIVPNYFFINTIMKANYMKAIYSVLEFLNHNINKNDICTINIPYLHELGCVMEEEIIWENRGIHLHRINEFNTKEDLQHLVTIYGETMCELYKSGKTTCDRKKKIVHGATIFSVLNEDRPNKIYLIGPCIATQVELMPEDTIVAHLQAYVDEICPEQYEVCGISVMSERYDLFENIVRGIDVFEGDKFMFLYRDLEKQEGMKHIELKNVFDTRKEYWFANEPMHVNQLGSRKVAEYIFENFLKNTCNNKGIQEVKMCASILEEEEEESIKTYLEKWNLNKLEGKNGAIVMNCNPYTRGHDYLISQASKKVDNLYIFVVEENRSFFSFEERIDLVKRGTAKYKNVIVVPSGKMILSMSTLPAYFQKEEHQEMKIDASDDIKLFGLGIAKELGITIRFVGEEPIDAVTRQYNEYVKSRLPFYGVELKEIPRCESEGEVISASKVRKLLKMKKFEEIEKIVPSVVYDYLKMKYS